MTWSRSRLKYTASLQAGTWGEEPGQAGVDVYCVRAADFDREHLRVSPRRLPIRSVDVVTAAELALRPGDIVLEKSGGGADQPVGGSVLFDLDVDAVCSNFAARLRPMAHVDPRFLNYLLAALYSCGVTDALAKQTTGIANLDVGAFMATEVRMPRAGEQSAIANYLDEETARLDAVVAGKRRQLELIESRVEAYIAAKLDDLVGRHGEVPLKAVADIRFSNVDKKSYEGEESVRLCNYTDVYYHRRIDSTLDFTTATASRDQVVRFTLRGGDVLITKDSETAEDIAVSAFVAEDLPGVVLGYHLAMARPTRIDPHFLYWALNSRRCRDAFSLAASGVTRYGLRQDAVGRVPIPKVDREVAAATAEAIASVVERGDRAATVLRQQVDVLAERREALITAAVTGQLDIPGVAA